MLNWRLACVSTILYPVNSRIATIIQSQFRREVFWLILALFRVAVRMLGLQWRTEFT